MLLHTLRLEINFIIVNPDLENLKPIPMRRNSTSSMGALHPILFFVFVYGLSLFLAFFVCRTVYNSIYSDTTVTSNTSLEISANANATAYK